MHLVARPSSWPGLKLESTIRLVWRPIFPRCICERAFSRTETGSPTHDPAEPYGAELLKSEGWAHAVNTAGKHQISDFEVHALMCAPV